MPQLQIESNAWKRLLNFFSEENVHSKNRLSDILKDAFDRNLLDALENFHSRFVKQDEVIGLLRSDIAELDKLLNDGINTEVVNRKLNNLRHNLSSSEKRFCELQLDFNKYLTENIG